MQIAPIPDLDPEINDVRIATANIVNRYIIPNEEKLVDYRSPDTQRLRHEIQEVVKKAGLWAPHLPKEYGGMGIGFIYDSEADRSRVETIVEALMVESLGPVLYQKLMKRDR